MTLGIKTTDGVSRVKVKTADGVTKAVECACCDPCSGLWGPGYDELPDLIYVSGCGSPLGRVSKCIWQLVACNIEDPPSSVNGSGSCDGSFDFFQPYISIHSATGTIEWALDGYFFFRSGEFACTPPDIFGYVGSKSDGLPGPLGTYYNEYSGITVTATA